jgi:hypothetical protein
MRQRQQREHIQEPWLCLWFFVDIVISPEQLMSNMPVSLLGKDVTFQRVRNSNPRLTAALLVLQLSATNGQPETDRTLPRHILPVSVC